MECFDDCLQILIMTSHMRFKLPEFLCYFTVDQRQIVQHNECSHIEVAFCNIKAARSFSDTSSKKSLGNRLRLRRTC